MCICIHTGDESEALNASEVGVLDGHDASLSEELLWVVIDELPVRRENKTNTGVSDAEIKWATVPLTTASNKHGGHHAEADEHGSLFYTLLILDSVFLGLFTQN